MASARSPRPRRSDLVLSEGWGASGASDAAGMADNLDCFFFVLVPECFGVDGHFAGRLVEGCGFSIIPRVRARCRTACLGFLRESLVEFTLCYPFWNPEAGVCEDAV